MTYRALRMRERSQRPRRYGNQERPKRGTLRAVAHGVSFHRSGSALRGEIEIQVSRFRPYHRISVSLRLPGDEQSPKGNQWVSRLATRHGEETDLDSKFQILGYQYCLLQKRLRRSGDQSFGGIGFSSRAIRSRMNQPHSRSSPAVTLCKHLLRLMRN